MTRRDVFPRPRPGLGPVIRVGTALAALSWPGCGPSSEPAPPPASPPVVNDVKFTPKERAKMREMDREEMLEYKKKFRESRTRRG